MEVWKDIKGYEGLYQVSNLGNVKSVTKKLNHKNQYKNFSYINKEIIMKKNYNKGYLIVTLSKSKIKKTFRIHRLVAETFIPNPENKPQVNHIDSNKENNRIENLEWCTASENVIHSIKKGFRNNKGELNKSSKLKEKDIKDIRRLNKFLNYKELGKMFNVNYMTIGKIIRKESWKHVED